MTISGSLGYLLALLRVLRLLPVKPQLFHSAASKTRKKTTETKIRKQIQALAITLRLKHQCFFPNLHLGLSMTSATAPRTAAALPQRTRIFLPISVQAYKSSHTKMHRAHRWFSGFCHHIKHQIYRT